MDANQELGKKIQEMQILEQNFQSILMQKQSMQLELNEIVNALQEIRKSSDDVYKMVGNIMIKSDKSELLKELEEKKKILEVKLHSVDKQEKILTEKSESLRNDINNSLKSMKKVKDSAE